MADTLTLVFGSTIPARLRFSRSTRTLFRRFAAVGGQTIAIIASFRATTIGTAFCRGRCITRLTIRTRFTASTAVRRTRLEIDASTITERVFSSANERADARFTRFTRRTLVETGTAVIHIRHNVGFFAEAFDDLRSHAFAAFTDLTVTTRMTARTAVCSIAIKRHACIATKRRSIGARTPRRGAVLPFEARIPACAAVIHIRRKIRTRSPTERFCVVRRIFGLQTRVAVDRRRRTRTIHTGLRRCTRRFAVSTMCVRRIGIKARIPAGDVALILADELAFASLTNFFPFARMPAGTAVILIIRIIEAFVAAFFQSIGAFAMPIVTRLIGEARVSAGTAVILITRIIEAFVAAFFQSIGAFASTAFARLIGKTHVSTGTTVILVARKIDARTATNRHIRRTFTASAFAGLSAHADISTGSAVLRVTIEIYARSPALRFIDCFRILWIGFTADFGRRADAIFTRFVRFTLGIAVAAMMHIRRKVGAKIEGFAFIGRCICADEFAGTPDALSAVGAGVSAGTAVFFAILEISAHAVTATRGTGATASASATLGGVVTARATITLELSRIRADAVTIEGSGFAAIAHIIVAVAVAVRTLAPAFGAVRISAAHVAARTAVLSINRFVDASAAANFHARRTRIRLTFAFNTRFVVFADLAARTAVIMRRLVIDAGTATFVQSLRTKCIVLSAASGGRTHAIVTRAITTHVSAYDETRFTLELHAIHRITGTTCGGKKDSSKGCSLYILGRI